MVGSRELVAGGGVEEEKEVRFEKADNGFADRTKWGCQPR